VAIGLVANAVFVWITDARLERQLAAIRAAGDSMTLADLAPKPIPPEKNAATYLRRAEADAKAIEEQVEVHEIWGRLYPSEYPLSPQVSNVLRSALDAHPNVIPLLKRAAACRNYNAQLDYTVSTSEFLNHQLISDYL
jgi:hypothetical protein